MDKKESARALILQSGFLPLYYNDSAAVSKKLLQALYDGGVRILEYTNRGVHAAENFEVLQHFAKTEMPGLMLGIGTIKTVEAARTFIHLGADFIVCPTVNARVAEVVEQAKLLWIPGCFTTTEIATAEAAGADIVKIFPGSIAGPGYITAISEIFPGIRFMPTGGVDTTVENLSAWFNSGVCAVGMGSKLITKNAYDEYDYAKLTADAALILKNIAALKQKQSI